MIWQSGFLFDVTSKGKPLPLFYCPALLNLYKKGTILSLSSVYILIRIAYGLLFFEQIWLWCLYWFICNILHRFKKDNA